MDGFGIEFVDLDSQQETYCGVRPIPGGIGLVLSTKAGQELEVFMTPAEAAQIATALHDLANGTDA